MQWVINVYLKPNEGKEEKSLRILILINKMARSSLQHDLTLAIFSWPTSCLIVIFLIVISLNLIIKHFAITDFNF